MTRTLASSYLVLAIACGDRVVASDEGDTSGVEGSASSSSSTAAGSTASGPSGTTSSGPAESSSGGLCAEDGSDEGPKFDVGPSPPTCDLFEQDCDAGTKCVPDSWIDTRTCVPIAAEPLADGEPCDPRVDDPCGALSWCGTEDDDGNGRCVPLCTGSFDEPECAGDAICVIDDEFITAFCAAPCDPFDAAACGAWSCQPTPEGFGCLPHGGGERNDWCAQHDSCVATMACAGLGEAEGCCHASCCTPLCDAAHPCERGECTPTLPPIPGAAEVGFCIGLD